MLHLQDDFNEERHSVGLGAEFWATATEVDRVTTRTA